MILFLGKFIMLYNRLQSYILVTGGTGVMGWKSRCFRGMEECHY